MPDFPDHIPQVLEIPATVRIPNDLLAKACLCLAENYAQADPAEGAEISPRLARELADMMPTDPVGQWFAYELRMLATGLPQKIGLTDSYAGEPE
jgi:hypothetical protein